MITGRVIDDTGVGIPSAVLISGGNATMTDQNGDFSMVPGDDSVTANYVGFEPSTKPVATWMEFKLDPSSNSNLNAVEITAQGGFVDHVNKVNWMVWIAIVLLMVAIYYGYKKGWFS